MLFINLMFVCTVGVILKIVKLNCYLTLKFPCLIKFCYFCECIIFIIIISISVIRFYQLINYYLTYVSKPKTYLTFLQKSKQLLYYHTQNQKCKHHKLYQNPLWGWSLFQNVIRFNIDETSLKKLHKFQ